MKLSIIVPCYQVEDYLNECIASFVTDAAALGDEIILVDDGSRDGTPALCDALAAEHPHVRVLHRENGGLSAARNTGMEAATGDYLQFVDSDDWLEPGALPAIHRALEAGPDALLLNVNRYRDGEQVSRSGHSAALLAGGYDAFLEGYIRKFEINGMAQCLILRRELAEREELSFHEGILHEDMEWTPLALCAAGSAAVLEEPVYAYRLAREGSIMAGLDEAALARRQESCMAAAQVLAGAASQAVPPRSSCLAHAAGLVFSQALQYAAKRPDGALKALAREAKEDILLRAASKEMPRRISLCTRALGLVKGTRVYMERWGK